MTTPDTPGRWNEPEGVNPRGTVLLFPGRGETADVYTRLGRRLAADAYRVAVVRSEQAAAIVADPRTVSPVVALGSDAGAVEALRFAHDHPASVAAVIVAGLTVDDAADRVIDGLGARTACPAHQGVLRSAHVPAVPPAIDLTAEFEAVARARLEQPILALHGAEDQISPVGGALERFSTLGVGQVALIEGGRHDILNDVTHRSVAATIVLFLERLRLGPGLPPIVREPLRDGAVT